MSDADPPAPGEPWLERARRLRAIAQTGLSYSRDDYDLERFTEIDAIARQMLAEITDTPPAQIRDLYLPERGYPTPKVDVRAGVFREGRVLLVQEAADGRWSLPGGWADEQESPRASVEREVLEESGFRVRAVKLVALKDRNLHPYRPRRLEHIYKLFFLCELHGGSAAASLETTDAGFFALDDLPERLPGGRLPPTSSSSPLMPVTRICR
ncbi:MAG: NUDIX hydrolase [Gammaproteobacteria bacterium]|nr:NUDIX hydrolase [Gammaproteobacteria bacterium]